jgi:LacI family transcriptional regulator
LGRWAARKSPPGHFYKSEFISEKLMKRKVSMSDIAKRLNVSRATVSYVLNDKGHEMISVATAAKVRATAQEMGYRPNRAAQCLGGQATYMVKLCASGFFPAFYGQVLHEFESQIGPTSYQLQLNSVRHWGDEEWSNVDGGWPLDGIIVFDIAQSDASVAILKRDGVPFVNSGCIARTDVDHVVVNCYAVVRELVARLQEKAERVAFLTPCPPEFSETLTDQRYHGYVHQMKALGREPEFIVAFDSDGFGDRMAVRQSLSAYIGEHGCPQALYCFNDEMAIAALATLRELKLRVPQDVQVVGFDGIDESNWHSPLLSTVVYPFAEVAAQTWRVLQHRIENPDCPIQSVTLKPQLAWRETTC